MAEHTDTIYALSTPVGGAIGIIRISGSKTLPLVRAIFSGRIAHRRCSYGSVCDYAGNLIDFCTLTYFEAPHSYTGEDMAELCVHGSYAVAQRMFALFNSHSLRIARAGEFTSRAFMNGKLDLAQADAVMDMIASTSELSRKAAAFQLEGGLSKRINNLYEKITDIVAYINATIDFPDEMEDYARGENAVAASINSILSDIELLIENGKNSRVLREGARVAIVGKPNAGKSSLLNALVEYERAIVTQIPGTTRDTIEETSQVCGIPVVFIDTAGIRSTSDMVEAIGVTRSVNEAESASVVLALFDGGASLCAEDYEVARMIAGLNAIAVLSKSDMVQITFSNDVANIVDSAPIVSVSSITGEGIGKLREVIASRLTSDLSEAAIVTNSRHIESLCNARSAILDAMGTEEPDCIATDLKNAMLHLGRITGKTADDDMLDNIFSHFCVGK